MAADPHATGAGPWGPYRLQLALGGAGLAASVLVLAAGVRAVHTRSEYADLRAQAEVAALVETFGDVALGHFARQMAQLDPESRHALERLARGD